MERLNKARISGRAGDVVFSHEINGKYYYNLMVTVVKDNGIADIFPVIVEDSILGSEEYSDKEVLVTGEIRSINMAKENKNPKNVSFVSANKIQILGEPIPGGDINEVEFIGKSYTKNPTVRETRVAHRKVTDLFIAIPRSKTRNDFVSCSFWGKKAEFAEKIQKFDFVKIKGKLVNRDFLIENRKETKYEVFVTEMEKIEDEK